MLRFEPIDLSDSSIKLYSSFLCSIFTKTKPKSFQYLDWEYRQNPCGKALGYNAFDGEDIVGHYVAQPIDAIIQGEKQRGLFALHVAVNQEYRGKNIFGEINNRTHELAKSQGFKFVIGVANSKSTYVYTQKLNFTLVCPLETRFGFGFPNLKTRFIEGLDYYRIWDEEDLFWRLHNPNNTYFKREVPGGTFIIGKTGKPFLYCLVNFVPDTKSTAIPNHIKNIKHNVPLVWYGYNNLFKWSLFKHFEIPEKLKPSPLNLIFLYLDESKDSQKINHFCFNPIDHDAF